MNNRTIILNSIKYIEEHLHTEITLQTLAKEFGFSTYYYSHLFKGITDQSPKEYITLRKVSASVDDLINSDDKIIDIAFNYGFNSHESYSRAFKRYMNQTPISVRQQKSISPIKLQPMITFDSLLRQKKTSHLEPEVVVLPEIYLVGIPFYVDITNISDLSSQWETLTDNLSNIKDLKTPHKFYQFQFWFPNQSDDSIYFFVGVEANSVDDLPIYLNGKVIPPQTYLRFKHHGRSNQVGKTYEFIYKEYLPQTNYRLQENYNFEYYGQEYLGPYNDASVSDIYIPIIPEELQLS